MSDLELTTESDWNPDVLTQMKFIPTGFASLDYTILKRGGLPMGRLVQLAGPYSSGKSLLSYRIVANAQKMDPRSCGIIDAEFTADPDWIASQGVDLKRLEVKQVNVAEDVYDHAISWLESKRFSVVVIDSIGNLEVADRMEGKRFTLDKTGKRKNDQPGVFEKVTTSAVKRLAAAAYRSNTLLVGVNQIRSSFALYGDPQETPGGHAWKHNLSVDIRMRPIKPIEISGEEVGIVVRARVKKSKISAGGCTDNDNDLKFYFDVSHGGKGIVYDVWDTAVRSGVVVRKGAWYVWEGGERRWQGQEKACSELSDDSELCALLIQQVKQSSYKGTGDDKVEDAVEKMLE